MSTFVFNNPANTYKQTTTGGTVSTAELKDIVVDWVNALEPWETPVLEKIMSNDEFDQELHQWGQSKRIRFDTVLKTSIDGSTQTLELPSGDSLLYQKWAVLAIYDPRSDDPTLPDESTKETVLVTAINTADDKLTVTRGFGTSASSHAANSFVRFIGTAEPLNNSHTEAPRIRGFREYNYPQRFQAQLQADKRAQNMPTWEHPTNSLLADFAEEMKKQKMLLQRSVFEGERKAGVGNSTPSMFGGLNTFLTTNAVNCAGAKIGVDDIDDILADLWVTSDTAHRKVLVMGMNEARILDSTIDPIRRATVQDDTLNRVVRLYRFRTGEFEVMPMREIPANNIYVLDWSLIKLRPFKGLNWHVSEKSGANHAVDHDVKAISGDFTLEVHSEHAMARIYNFDGNLDNYRQGYGSLQPIIVGGDEEEE